MTSILRECGMSIESVLDTKPVLGARATVEGVSCIS